MKNKDYVWLSSHFEKALKSTSDISFDTFLNAKKIILKYRKNNFFFFGNGASNTIATHGALDISNQLGIKCCSINDASVLTANSNDFGYENAIARYAKINFRKNDVIFLISSSGESKNVIETAKVAKNIGCKIITLTGFDYLNTLSKMGNVNFWCNSCDYNIVESIHNFWLVTICDLIIKDEKNKIGKHGRIL